MKHYELSSQPRTPSVPAARTVPWGRRWPQAALALVALGAVLWAVLWALWPAQPPAALHTQASAPVAQAQRAGQAWPFAAGAPVADAAEPAAATHSPWDRLQPVADEDEAAQGPDPRTLNAGIAPERLSVQRRLAAQDFLDHVVLQPEPRGGYMVQAVLPGSVYARSGLRPGDTVYTLDLPDQPPVEESNMVALTSVHELTFQVVRAGALVRLSVRLNEETPSDGQG